MKDSRFIINDVDPLTAQRDDYDIAFYAIGYERRSVYILGLHELIRAKKSVIFRFNNARGESHIKEALEQITLGDEHRVVDIDNGYEQAFIGELVSSLSSLRGNSLKILVDYSSMTREMYASVLCVVRQLNLRGAQVWFAYAGGRHIGVPQFYSYGSPLCLPGCDASSSKSDRTVAVVGFGFEASSLLSLVDRLEPDHVYAIYADPATEAGYENTALSANQDICELYEICAPIAVPFSSVSSAYQAVYELVVDELASASVVLLPYGPKPHVLASMLFAMSWGNVSCVHVPRKSTPHEVIATGELAISVITSQ